MTNALAYTVHFDRIGRTHDAPPLTVTSDSPDHLAMAIHKYAAQFLHSQEYEVNVDLERGRGSIEFGRFGTFAVKAEVQS